MAWPTLRGIQPLLHRSFLNMKNYLENVKFCHLWEVFLFSVGEKAHGPAPCKFHQQMDHFFDFPLVLQKPLECAFFVVIFGTCCKPQITLSFILLDPILTQLSYFLILFFCCMA